MPVQIHVSETEGEVEGCLGAARRCARRPTSTAAGCSGPGTVLAHGVWLDEAELDLIAERGATIVTNPVANMKLAVGGVFPYLAARARKVAVGLGTDGPGRTTRSTCSPTPRRSRCIQKHVAGDPAAVTAHETFEIATGARSELLARRQAGGGARADFLLVRSAGPELAPGELIAEPGLRGLRLGRRHDGRRRQGADAGRGGGGGRRGRGPRA